MLATRVWISDAAAAAFLKYQKRENPKNYFAKKLERYATNGFRHYISEDGPIKNEGEGIFRIGDGSLFRLIGFFENGSNFIVIDAFLKKGQRLNASEQRRIDEVIRVRLEKRWSKTDG